MADTVVVQARAHIHELRVVEVLFEGGAEVRLLECRCGATDVDAAA